MIIDSAEYQNIPDNAKINMIRIVSDETVTGNHTGAIHGFGIRKSTSTDLSDGGHFIRI